MPFIKSFISDTSGATAIEYALIAAFIAIAIVGGASALGNKVSGSFNKAEAGL